MYLDVRLDSPSQPPVLREPDDFRSFKVAIRGTGSDDRLADALAGIGRLDGADHVYLEIDAVQRLAGARAAQPEWQRSFAAMVDYARGKGWLSADGTQIRAHCERPA